MKFNLCTLALAAIALGVTARPAIEDSEAKSVVLRHDGEGVVGDLFSREDGNDGLGDGEDTDDVEDEDGDKDEDADYDEGDDDDKDPDEDAGDGAGEDADDDGGEDTGEDAGEDADDDGDEESDDQDGDEVTSTITGISPGSTTATKTSDISGSMVTSTGSSSVLTTGMASPSSGSSSGDSLPASAGSTALSAVQTIAAGGSFDGGYVVYDRGVSCTGQVPGGDSDAVFHIEDGGSLSNVIIGPNQIQGVICLGTCTLINVWWSAVCQAAVTVESQGAGETTTISGGGAFGADDKVIQHNGGGTITISNFTADDFGTLYQSCSNCISMYERHVIIDAVTAISGELLAGINSNYGDSATITNVDISDVDEICEQFEGNDTGDEPASIATGSDGIYCVYSSDVTTA